MLKLIRRPNDRPAVPQDHCDHSRTLEEDFGGLSRALEDSGRLEGSRRPSRTLEDPAGVSRALKDSRGPEDPRAPEGSRGLSRTLEDSGGLEDPRILEDPEGLEGSRGLLRTLEDLGAIRFSKPPRTVIDLIRFLITCLNRRAQI